ncbi:MAG: DEAD/DEAH box helicase [Flavobacteriaceae bacterium]|nr:DEAD/DEAH box helicase [Flavobacteriaceae bacterium]
MKPLDSKVLKHLESIKHRNTELHLLHPKVIQWVHRQKWSSLRYIQKRAIEPILNADTDVVISAPTAGGKTEAFFLPACSSIINQRMGYGILYISPLKALINDQKRRLESLAEQLAMRVMPWHGDVSATFKKRSIDHPNGILLITPESLESLLTNKSELVSSSMRNLKYICIDEFHAFIGNERGQQMLSLLSRLEHLIGRTSDPIPRIALSATFGDDIEAIHSLLRPDETFPYLHIQGEESDQITHLSLKGFIDSFHSDTADERFDLTDVDDIVSELYGSCIGANNLIFLNSRKNVEKMTAMLADYKNQKHPMAPNEFFTHHGSLAKDLRESLEKRLKDPYGPPTTALCTTTLELGIDIGKVDKVFQVLYPPNSVSSLRQRYGRSGRRQSKSDKKGSDLRMFILEKELTIRSGLLDALRPNLIQSLAMLKLIVCDRWYEPPEESNKYFSTFIHQILAVIAQWGSVRTDHLFQLLCHLGPFKKVDTTHFKEILVHLKTKELIEQLKSGEITLGFKGNRIVEHYDFFTVFTTPVEYRIVTEKSVLGTVPIGFTFIEGQNMIFAGKYWRIESIDTEKKVITVSPIKGGKAPSFFGDGMMMHHRIAQEMYQLYQSGTFPKIENERFRFHIEGKTMQLFEEAVKNFRTLKLNLDSIIQVGEHCYLFTWMGTKVTDTLVLLLQRGGFDALRFSDFSVEIIDASRKKIKDYIYNTLLNDTFSTEFELASMLPRKQLEKEKYDRFLPDSLLYLSHGSRAFDLERLKDWVAEYFSLHI